MKVLITGGAGFIGRHTSRQLLQQGHELRILDVLDPQIHGAQADFPQDLMQVAECIRGDVRDLGTCAEALKGMDAVYHFVSRTGVGQSMYDMTDYVSTNLVGTTALIEAIVKHRLPLQRFVLSSSRAVYGEGLFRCERHGVLHPPLRSADRLAQGDFHVHCPQCGGIMAAVPTTTNCAPAPISVYALTKMQQEDYAHYAARTFGLPLVVLRYFNVYGSLQSLRNPYTGVVSIFNSLLRDGKPISLYERGLPVRDFVHVSDVARANVLALNPGLSSGSVFNVGSGLASTIGEVATAQARAMGLKVHLEDAGEYRVGDVFGCFADLSTSMAQLGFRPAVDLDAGMREFVAWSDGEPAVNLYEKTVAELSRHGLFGRAGTRA